MDKIIIIYHSGVGNTKLVAKSIEKQLNSDFDTEIYSVEKLPDGLELSNYRGVVLGFPTIHTHPTKRILEFIDGLTRLQKKMPAYIFTTCGLYSANTLRIFSKKCMSKNIIPVVNHSFRCAAIDGILFAPGVRFFFTNEKRLEVKIVNDCNEFKRKLVNLDIKPNIPRFKLYSILNYPNKLMGQHYVFPIYLHKDRCIKCGRCTMNCPGKAMYMNEENYPVYLKEKCERCYRCIHHCPKMALSLSKKKAPKKVLPI